MIVAAGPLVAAIRALGGCGVLPLILAEEDAAAQTIYVRVLARARAGEADQQNLLGRIDLDRKTLDQYLEQLRVAVRFQERESASLVAYLARVMKPKR